MFETAEVGSDGKCPKGFSPANPPSPYYQTKIKGKTLHVQCLKIKVRQDKHQQLHAACHMCETHN